MWSRGRYKCACGVVDNIIHEEDHITKLILHQRIACRYSKKTAEMLKEVLYLTAFVTLAACMGVKGKLQGNKTHPVCQKPSYVTPS